MNALSLFWMLALCICLQACSKSKEPASDSTQKEVEAAAASEALPFDQRQPKLTFDHDVSAILAREDDYISTLSAFDYAAKFKSDSPLNEAQRKEAYAAALQEYTSEEIQRLETAFEKVLSKMDGMTVKLPETIHIFSEQAIESGAAYTRANTICMPKAFIANMDDDHLVMLAAHEMFHVISRHNLELRPAMYAILGFEPIPPLTLPKSLADLTIANPDAPDMDYAIAGRWRGEGMRFVPILHSERAYDEGSFFQYLNDDLLAVNVLHDRTEVVLEDGQPLIAKKKDVEGYFEQVGENTHYNFHPEETSADHFMLLLLMDTDKLPDPEKVEALGELLRG